MKVNLFNANIDVLSMRHLRHHLRVGKKNISLRDPLDDALGKEDSDGDVPWQEHEAFDNHEMLMNGGAHRDMVKHLLAQQPPQWAAMAAMFGAGMQVSPGMSAQRDQSDEE